MAAGEKPGGVGDTPPNIIFIYTDDLGYGDVPSYFPGTPIRTPFLDQMIAEGLRFTDCYAPASVCTPSRAGLLTGRLAARSGMAGDFLRVLFPPSTGGLPQSEVTIAEVLRNKGYATACIGKWHLGHTTRDQMPNAHGFDEFFGVPYSNDMVPFPLMRNETVLQEPAPMAELTGLYTQEARSFIAAHAAQPFFMYLAHTFPHDPLAASSAFLGSSAGGLYGDVVEELDNSLGRVLAALRELGLTRRTLVVFTSDNGPNPFVGGFAGRLRGFKASPFEGGFRVPCVAWWPGRIPAGTVSQDIVSHLDWFPTFANLAGGLDPLDGVAASGPVLDGVDLRPVLFGRGPGGRTSMPYYHGTHLVAFRQGPWKLHFLVPPPPSKEPVAREPLLLYDLTTDPGEENNLAGQFPGVVNGLLLAARRHTAGMTFAPSQL